MLQRYFDDGLVHVVNVSGGMSAYRVLERTP